MLLPLWPLILAPKAKPAKSGLMGPAKRWLVEPAASGPWVRPWASACGPLLVRAGLALDGGKGEWTAAAIESLKDDLVFLSLLHFNGLQRVAFKEVLLL